MKRSVRKKHRDEEALLAPLSAPVRDFVTWTDSTGSGARIELQLRRRQAPSGEALPLESAVDDPPEPLLREEVGRRAAEVGEVRERALEGVGRDQEDAVEALLPRRPLLREAVEVRSDRVLRVGREEVDVLRDDLPGRSALPSRPPAACER